MTDTKMTLDSRRKFIKNISLASVLLLSGKWASLTAAEVMEYQDKVKLRFVVASDAHYGQPDTPYEQMMDTITQQINLFHHQRPLDFCVMNGDLIHNEKSFLPLVKSKLDSLNMPLFVTRGNHDMVSDAYWNEIWGMPLNHDAVVKEYAILLGDTSNEKGLYVSPNLDWLSNKLEQHKNKKHCFIFLHIPQAKWTANGIDTPAVFEIIKKHLNVKAVFHGHEHDQDGVKMVEKVPFLFDAHIGGSWGTAYKGFRVVELMKDDTLITYMMNPTVKMNELSL